MEGGRCEPARNNIVLSINNNSKAYLMCGIALAGLAGLTGYTVVDKVQNLVPVVVATQNIAPHTQITSQMVKTVEVPALGRSSNAIDDPALVVGGYTTSKVFADQTIIQPMVAKQFDETGASGMALSIPNESLRAVSFEVTQANAVGGQIHKGDFVDILVTLNADSLGSQTSVTKTILQGIEVSDVGGGKNGDEVTSLTLLLNLEQAEIVKHAYSMGSVSYALNPGNSVSSRTAGVTNNSFMERFGFKVVKPKQSERKF